MRGKSYRLLAITGYFIIAAAFLIASKAAAAGIIDQLGEFGVKPGSATSAGATAPASPPSPITSLSARGTAALDVVDSHSGVCSDAVVPCSGSDTCECNIFKGTVTLPKPGKSNLTLNITTDDTAGTNDGSGSCFPGTGHGTVCNIAGTSCLSIFVAGKICTGVVSETSSTTGDVNFDADEIFYIVPSTSTGTVAGGSGGGSLEIIDDIKIVSSVITSIAGYSVFNGSMQAHP
jgi:hypothetical protein